jgi:hypothetical protein
VRLPLRVVAAAALGGALLFMAHASRVALREHITVPYLDDWRILDGFLSRPLLAWLSEGQTGHRMPGTQLLLALDYTLLAGQMHLLVVAMVACTWLAWVAAGLVLRHSPPAREVRVLMLAFTGLALFWAGACHDYAWGTNHGSQQAVLLICTALAALAAFQARRLDGRPIPRGVIALATVAAMGATFSQAAGAAVWGALVGIAVLARLPWRVTVILTVAALATVALYSHGLETPYRDPGRVYLSTLGRYPGLVLWFVASFVGITPTVIVAGVRGGVPTDTPNLGFGCGVAGLAGLVLYGLWVHWRRERMTPAAVFALGLMIFAPVAGVLVALNRLPWGMAGQERFVTWSTLFWIGALWALASVLPRRAAPHGVAAVIAGLALAAVPALRVARIQQAARADMLRWQGASLVLDIRSDSLVRYSLGNPRPDMIDRVTDRLRRDRRSIFGDPLAALPGARLDEHFVSVADGRCRGAVYALSRLTTRAVPAASLSGFAWDQADDERPSFLVVTDRADRIRGLGTFIGRILPPPDGWDRRAHWMGFVADPKAGEHYGVYGVLADGRSVCRVAHVSGAELAAAPLERSQPRK